MKNIIGLTIGLSALLSTFAIASSEKLQWPNGEKIAVSLSYDDALNSHLDHAIPALDKYQLKASFYILPNQVLTRRLNEWKTIARNGHELGNHSLFHPCKASLPNREWVVKHHDLDKYSVEQIAEELVVANRFLHAIDGNKERTFTPPCADRFAGGKDYISQVKDQFIAIKGQEFPSDVASIWGPSNVSGEALINHIVNAAPTIKIVNIVFHGIGGDHLSVSTAAHQQLLSFLAQNQHVYYVDTYLNIMTRVNQQK